MARDAVLIWDTLYIRLATQIIHAVDKRNVCALKFQRNPHWEGGGRGPNIRKLDFYGG